jgi:thiol-disulfide isomerase/thioredoxin
VALLGPAVGVSSAGPLRVASLHGSKSDRLLGPAASAGAACVIAALLGLAVAGPASAGTIGVGSRLPHVSLAEAQARRVTLVDGQAPVTIVEFWATWCAPCRAALPAYAELARRHAPQVQLVAINIDRDRAVAERFLAQYLPQSGATFLFDPDNRTMAEWGAPGMPSLYVAVNGVVRFVHAGDDADTRDRVARLVDEALGAVPTSAPR